MSEPAAPGDRLVLRGVRKSFGATAALGGVEMVVRAGEVHALIGENGAGKSTLLGLLAGAIAPDAGEILLDGAPYRPGGPRDARLAGVAIVHQELSLCPHLTVAENVLLGALPTRHGLLARAEMHARAKAALAQLRSGDEGVVIAPDALVGDLPPASRQLVEIARALAQTSARVLLLDEPTSSLASDDASRLLGLVRALKTRGVTVVYISHFLEEVREVADSFTVLRDGKTVGSGTIAKTDLSELVRMMVGRQVDELFPTTPRKAGEIVLEVKDLAGVVKPSSASLTLRRGEVLGLAGLVGAGRTELVRAVFGLDPVRKGEIRVAAWTGTASPGRRLAQGVGLLSEDRKGEGIARSMSVADNITLSKLTGLGPAGLVMPERQRDAARRWIERLGIRCAGPDQAAADLSGGNQQKLALARLLHHDVDVLLLDEPTRGIDVGSKAQVYELIARQAALGKAVLMVSSYLPELFGVCDRIAVMRRGVLGSARSVSELSQHGVLLEATGG